MEHTIRISRPHEGDQHTWTAPVVGHVTCGDKGALVQALVHAADNKWYPQADVMREPWGFFLVGVKLGFKEDAHEKFYTIAVGLGGQKVLEPIEGGLENLPQDTLWTTVSVERI